MNCLPVVSYTVLANGQPVADCVYCNKRHPHPIGSVGSILEPHCSTRAESRSYTMTEEREINDSDRTRAH